MNEARLATRFEAQCFKGGDQDSGMDLDLDADCQCPSILVPTIDRGSCSRLNMVSQSFLLTTKCSGRLTLHLLNYRAIATVFAIADNKAKSS